VSHSKEVEVGTRGSEGEESKQAIESPLSLSEAYRLAKHMEGDLGAARLGKALREDGQGQVAAVLFENATTTKAISVRPCASSGLRMNGVGDEI
jgi:hypothetical protein